MQHEKTATTTTARERGTTAPASAHKAHDDTAGGFVVTAAGSPLFSNFLMLVSVTTHDGQPVTGLKPANFQVHHLASLNHASVNDRNVTEAKEGPAGFYTLKLQPESFQPDLPPGRYVFAVGVSRTLHPNGKPQSGQAIALGEIPK